MKKDHRVLSETTDVISLSALLREVLAEARERPPRRVPADVRRPADTGICQAPLSPGYSAPVVHPAARLRLGKPSSAGREAVA